VRFLPAAAGNPPKCEITRQSGPLGASAVPAVDQGSGCGQQLGRALQTTAAHSQGRPGRYRDARDHRRVPFAGDGWSCQPVPGWAQPAGWPGCLLWSGGLCPSCSGGGNHGRRCLCCAGCDCLHLVHVLGLQGKRPSHRNQEGCEPLSHIPGSLPSRLVMRGRCCHRCGQAGDRLAARARALRELIGATLRAAAEALHLLGSCLDAPPRGGKATGGSKAARARPGTGRTEGQRRHPAYPAACDGPGHTPRVSARSARALPLSREQPDAHLLIVHLRSAAGQRTSQLPSLRPSYP